MKYDDLPARLQQQVDVQLDQPAKRRRSRASMPGPVDARCECGTPLTTEAQINKHPAGPGHCRVEIIANANESR